MENLIERIPSPNIREDFKMESFKPIDAKTIGLVIYQDVQQEEERQKEFLTHVAIKEWIEDAFKDNELQDWVIGAETGDLKGHYHYQCVVQFKIGIHKRKGYGRMSINGVCCYYVYEKGHSWKSLVKYCQKEGNFIASAKAMEAAKKNKVEVLLEKKTRTERIEYLVQNQPDVLLKGDLGRTLDNLEKAEKYLNSSPSCGYQFPEYLLERSDTDLIYKWYERECIGKKYGQRRKALVLYSKERALGKTMLAKSISGGLDEDYIICRGNFNKTQFDKPHARLLILDDMNFMSGQMEMWKALVTGERVSIREAYCNLEFANGLPCIITTNSYRTFKFMVGSEYFANDCYFSWVKNYLGPDGTQRVDNPEAFRDFVLEDLIQGHTEEESKMADKRKEAEVTTMELEKKFRDLKKIKLN
jgi:hypothetical protein